MIPSLSTLVRHHLATPAQPLPDATAGLTWIWAANGLFKRGVGADLDALIQIADYVPRGRASQLVPPGLAPLLPHVQWPAWPGRRIGGTLLDPLLASARHAVVNGTAIEKQFFIVAGAPGALRLIAPSGQQATPARVTYAMPAGERILVDIHSHHQMPPFFSATDDADDLGLSVSVVIGTIFTQPTIRCRLNVYGHRQAVPARLIFDQLGPFVDSYGVL